MGSGLAIRQSVLENVLAHALERWPQECCGLLLGTERRVESAYRARNLRASPTRFLIDPDDHFAALREARARGVAVVGAYHSHPGSPPEPSTHDVREASGGLLFHLIAAPTHVIGPRIRIYDTRDEAFREVAYVSVI